MTADRAAWLSSLQHGRLYYRPAWIDWHDLEREILARYAMEIERARGNAFRMKCPHCGRT